jgi:hypothetical protein
MRTQPAALYLEALGAAKERDDIHVASAYCPITGLDHDDMAYERQFSGVTEFIGRGSTRPPAGRGQGDPGRAGGSPPGQGTADSRRGGRRPPVRCHEARSRARPRGAR